MVISHNLLAMNAQRQFNITGTQKKKSTEKLASGYKINRAADDAAGLAISEKMRRQIRGLDQGARNTQDGISLLQVADGALSEVHDMLHRVTELSVQAANDTNTKEDRDAIQQEINQIMSEIDRISDTTEFNTQKIFSGGSYEVIPAVYQDTTFSGFAVTGEPSGFAAQTYVITADRNGVRFDGQSFAWSEFKGSSSNSIADDPITADTYSMSYKGLTLSMTAEDGADIEDAIGTLNGAKFIIGETIETTETENIISSIYPSRGSYGTVFFQHDLGEDSASINYEGNKIIINTGVGNETATPITMECTIFPSLDTQFYAGDTMELRFEYKNSVQAGLAPQATHAFIGIQIKEDATMEEILNSLESSKINSEIDLNYDTTSTGESRNYAMYAVDKTYGFGQKAVKGSVWLDVESNVDAGYFKGEQYIDFTFDGESWISDNGEIVLSNEHPYNNKLYYTKYANYVSGVPAGEKNSFASFDFGTWDNLKYPETGDKIRLTDCNLQHDMKYTITSIEPEKITVTGRTESLDDVNGTNYKGRIITPEKKIYENDKRKWWIQSGADVGDGMFITIGTMNAGILGIDNISVSSHDNAGKAIEAASKATEIISELRSSIGAQQNRLEHTYKNVTNTAENTQAAESRIRDTDMAKEMVELSKHNILEQVGTSMIAQANQSNQGVLNLLQ